MLAGEFAAGTGAFEGGTIQIDLGFIRCLAAAPAFASQGGFAFAEIRPLMRYRQLAAGLGRSWIGGERQDLLSVEGHRCPSRER